MKKKEYEDFFTRNREPWMFNPKTLAEAKERYSHLKSTISISKDHAIDKNELERQLEKSVFKDEILKIIQDERVWSYERLGSPNSEGTYGREIHIFMNKNGAVLSIGSAHYD